MKKTLGKELVVNKHDYKGIAYFDSLRGNFLEANPHIREQRFDDAWMTFVKELKNYVLDEEVVNINIYGGLSFYITNSVALNLKHTNRKNPTKRKLYAAKLKTLNEFVKTRKEEGMAYNFLLTRGSKTAKKKGFRDNLHYLKKK